MVVKHGQHWAVIHAHAKKKGSKTDKPKGSVIKEFSTKKQALAMHRAIILSKKGGVNYECFSFSTGCGTHFA